MDTILRIGSVLGIINALVLIFYAFFIIKGNKRTNRLFGMMLIGLFIVLFQFVLYQLIGNDNPLLANLVPLGILITAPAFLFFIKSLKENSSPMKLTEYLHFLPPFIFIIWVVIIDFQWESLWTWQLVNHGIILLFAVYLMVSIYRINQEKAFRNEKKELNTYAFSLLIVGLAALVSQITGLTAVIASISYIVLITISMILLVNKGQIIKPSKNRYRKSGLKEGDVQHIKNGLEKLLIEEKYFTDHLISLPGLAKRLKTNTHALSQVINEQYRLTFFELIAKLRIEEAKRQLKVKKEAKIAEIAYDVGFNSISAFNTSFKKHTGLTPGKFRNG